MPGLWSFGTTATWRSCMSQGHHALDSDANRFRPHGEMRRTSPCFSRAFSGRKFRDSLSVPSENLEEVVTCSPKAHFIRTQLGSASHRSLGHSLLWTASRNTCARMRTRARMGATRAKRDATQPRACECVCARACARGRPPPEGQGALGLEPRLPGEARGGARLRGLRHGLRARRRVAAARRLPLQPEPGRPRMRMRARRALRGRYSEGVRERAHIGVCRSVYTCMYV